MTMKTVRGDLLALAVAGEFDVIVHGCNCLHAMGAGIARSIRKQFPEAFEADLATEKGARSKLGTYSSATIETKFEEDDNGVLSPRSSFTVVNAYTQFHWKVAKGQRNADYEAIRSVFAEIKKDFAGKRVGYPKIGAGLAGGSWKKISKIIDEELGKDTDHTLVIYDDSFAGPSPVSAKSTPSFEPAKKKTRTE